MQKLNLRYRILAGFAVFMCVQFFLMVAIAIYSYHTGEDKSLARVVKTNGSIQEFSAHDEVPALVPVELLGYPPGIHELSGNDIDQLSGIEIHVFVYEKDNSSHFRVLLLDEESSWIELAKVYGFFALVASALLIAFGGWASNTIASRVSRPMEELTASLEKHESMDGSVVFYNAHQTGETSLVAQALDKAISRVNDTREREKTLARNISHELRTPLTVIRTALDGGTGNSNIPSQNALESARRACDEMELLTGACLELAAEPSYQHTRPITNIVDTVKQIVRESLHLLDSKSNTVNLQIEHQKIDLPVTEALARLVIGNAIRNAFIHCTDGEITIALTQSYLHINNPVQDEKHVDTTINTRFERRFGVGLSILGQASKRLGWSFDLQPFTNENSGEKSALSSLHFAVS